MMKTLFQLTLLFAIALGMGCVVMFLVPSSSPPIPLAQNSLTLLPTPERPIPPRTEAATQSGRPTERTNNPTTESTDDERELIRQLREAADKVSRQISRDTTKPEKSTDAQQRQPDSMPSISLIPRQGDSQARLKMLGEFCDSLPPEVAAKIFIQMSEEHLNDSVIKLLMLMSDRPVAKVLAEISKTEEKLAVELTEQLLVRKPVPSTVPVEREKSSPTVPQSKSPSLP